MTDGTGSVELEIRCVWDGTEFGRISVQAFPTESHRGRLYLTVQ